MTKGNWERRAEMANIKRELAKERKRVRNLVASHSVESIFARLHKIPGYPTILVFLSSTENISVCSEWLRTEFCTVKRCKLLHEGISVSSLRGVLASSSESAESMCDPPIPLSQFSTKQLGRVRFISVDGRCVYDYAHDSVWIEYWNTNQPPCPDRRLDPIDEGDNSAQDSEEISDLCTDFAGIETLISPASSDCATGGAGALTGNILINASTSPRDGLSLHHSIFGHTMSFLEYGDIVSLILTSRSSKACCFRCEQVQCMKRKHLSREAAEGSRLRKLEKKKKAKSAALKKVDKKDGFSRGMK